MSDPMSPGPPRQPGEDARELAALRQLKAEAARLWDSAERFLADHPGAAVDVGWALEELMRVNARLDGRLRELQQEGPEGATPAAE